VINLAKLPTWGRLQWRLGRQLLSQHSDVYHWTTQEPSLVLHPSINSPLKRSIDILGAIVGLILTGVITLPIAIAIYVNNPGPIFYSQQRCGLHGKLFRIWKFRSMVTDAESLQHLVTNQARGCIFKNDRDPRVTAVGHILRRTSLDELPQFWNVLWGDMSLVGTRPPTLAEVQGYSPRHWERLNVKPGITGEWQANGRSQIDDFEQIVKLDLRYQQRWSIAYDLYLVVKTISAVLQRKGAY
jgi:lipopolysaccharide/colanic/teichoic acid biosynthesis glycosyltransferase